MTSRPIRVACLAASLGLLGGVTASGPAAWAAGNSGSASGIFIDFGGSFPGIVPANCPPAIATDDLGLFFVSGNTNSTDGNGTVEGDAYYVALTGDGPLLLALGHATKWGNDKAFTVTFDGISDAGQTIDFHMTGNPRSLQQVGNMTCS